MFPALQTWLSTPSDKPKLLVIYWPTACWKTVLTIEMAKQYNWEVISADSRQIYRGMNIGTGKITPEEMQGIPHYMLDIRDITESYSVGEYAPEVKRIISEIHSRGKLPILSWGTGLFIDAVVGNFSLPETAPDWEYRAELEKIRETEWEQKLWDMLFAIDPDYATELDARNYRYVMRALEVFRATGKSKKSIGKLGEEQYDTFFLTPFDGNRAGLYERINERVLGMFEQGLVTEVQQFLQKNKEERRNNKEGIGSLPPWQGGMKGGCSNISEIKGELGNGVDSTSLRLGGAAGMTGKLPGLNAIGYREVIDFLTGIKTLPEAIEAVQTNSRHYAKRQLTWFRRYQIEKIDGFFGA